jgi:hypothetical protein
MTDGRHPRCCHGDEHLAGAPHKDVSPVSNGQLCPYRRDITGSLIGGMEAIGHEAETALTEKPLRQSSEA